MRRNGVLAAVLGLALLTSGATLLTSGAAWARFAGPGPGITGNDTGGIFPYSPDIEGSYRDIAAAHCARWGRLSHITSVHRKYGDYVSFVCIDRPNMIH
jgi:hypothetical protein